MLKIITCLLTQTLAYLLILAEGYRERYRWGGMATTTCGAALNTFTDTLYTKGTRVHMCRELIR